MELYPHAYVKILASFCRRFTVNLTYKVSMT